jgi:hypothetical protein
MIEDSRNSWQFSFEAESYSVKRRLNVYCSLVRLLIVPVLKYVAKKRIVEANRLGTLACVTVNYKSVEIAIVL